MALEHPPPFGNHWRSRWIWFEPPAIVMPTLTRPERAVDGDQVGLFRRRFDVAEVPAAAPCRLWSDGRHVLSVNGRVVARGPVRSEPRRSHYDLVDLAPHLRVGENVLAVTAVHFAHQTSWWMPVPPSYSLGAGSLTLEACIGDPDDGAWIVTDASWRSCRGEAWAPVQPPGDVSSLPLEWFDARMHPRDWDEPGFDDSGWSAAHEIHPVHTGTGGSVHPPSEPFGVLRPPVRADAGAPEPVVHQATPAGTRALPAGAAHREGSTPTRSSRSSPTSAPSPAALLTAIAAMAAMAAMAATGAMPRRGTLRRSPRRARPAGRASEPTARCARSTSATSPPARWCSTSTAPPPAP